MFLIQLLEQNWSIFSLFIFRNGQFVCIRIGVAALKTYTRCLFFYRLLYEKRVKLYANGRVQLSGILIRFHIILLHPHFIIKQSINN